MLPRDRARWALVAVICVALLMAPALWNGFPLLQYDTGGYLARWFEGYLVPSRAVLYGLVLVAGAGANFWPVVVLQSALTVWVVHLVLRAHGYGRAPVLLGVIAALTALTTLPWLSAILLTDIFCGLGVLALYLLLLRGSSLRTSERIGLVVLTAAAAATHSATLAVLIAIFASAVLWRLLDHGRIALLRLREGFAALLLGTALVFAANFAVSGTLSWTPGGIALSFGRMLQDGIVDRYLADHCPDPRLQLCAHRAELPRDADAFFWGGPLFNRLGRFVGLGDEMTTIAFGSLADYPLLQLKSAVSDTLEQLVLVRSGEGVVNSIWHTYGIIQRYTPAAVPAMAAARQQRGELNLEAFNRLHYPLALIALAMLPGILLTLRHPRFAMLRELAAVVTLAVLANAVVCGVFSNPHDRYGARVVWLASLIALIFVLQLTRPTKFE